MQAGAVLALKDGTLAADNLDGVEHPVPEADTGKGKGASQGSLLCDKHITANYNCYNAGNDCRHGNNFPVILVDEHAQILAQVDSELGDPTLMLFLFHAGSPSFGASALSAADVASGSGVCVRAVFFKAVSSAYFAM